MLQTIIVLVIIGISMVFTARWTWKKLSGRAPICCGEDMASCPACASRKPEHRRDPNALP